MTFEKAVRGGVTTMWHDSAIRRKSSRRQGFNEALTKQKRPPGEDPAGALW
ncbi:hypothetical protein [Rhizobium laguerreae]|uniref:hypothetical protein n=1 Tax=Rhizobium laguerreae TaxID=1076926 RepID=UPI0014054648|nr:hypothetical protein [Rhizobium laguerreae]MBY3123424.1 hypothetical protein [Rhizobium laguerreae]MBY3220068.1 hypothetical protein [Rhizobium laguerreae]MBY3251994.1 hypothetical protein [Rhizobium laguerreae]MBY3276813.1 hypothetical protein [Rhizobium laguerreae]